ncbi:MAG TPA: hypothetical protein VGA52_14550 [Anaerolineales bacterium]
MQPAACDDSQREVEAALAEWERLRLPPSEPAKDPSRRRTPVMGGDLRSRFYETIGRQEAAGRRYRTAVRRLAECLRSQRAATRTP